MILDTQVVQDQPELLSSKLDEVVEQAEYRAINWVTVLTTTYTFVPQTIKVTQTLAGNAGLLCLPSGYAVC